jgi:hypothetical protein
MGCAAPVVSAGELKAEDSGPKAGVGQRFTDITAQAGVGGPHYGRLVYGGHGIHWVDITGNGLPDMYVTMIFPPTDMKDLFYRNVDGTKFIEEGSSRGIESFDCGSHSSVWADFDNDGDYDLVNGVTWCDRIRVYSNDGRGKFTDRSSGSGIENVPFGTRAILAFDYDNDGFLDIFGNSWGPDKKDSNELYRNNGKWTFVRVHNGLTRIGGAQGATEGDYDNDGDLDLLICSWGGEKKPLRLFRNNEGKSFSDATNHMFDRTRRYGKQDGVTWSDINNDGWLDIHVQEGDIGGQGHGWLYINNRDGTFSLRPVPQGPGFMAGFEDLDNDGDWDMVYAGDNKVYLNDGKGNFTVSRVFKTGTIQDPRAVAFADIEGDGDMDFFYAQKRSYNMLIRNDLAGAKGHWLRVRLVSPKGQAGAFGAKVKIYEAGQVGKPSSLVCFREARSQEGYLGQNDPVLHFGLGRRSKVDVEVRFLDGTVGARRKVTANQTIIIEGRRSGGVVK